VCCISPKFCTENTQKVRVSWMSSIDLQVLHQKRTPKESHSSQKWRICMGKRFQQIFEKIHGFHPNFQGENFQSRDPLKFTSQLKSANGHVAQEGINERVQPTENTHIRPRVPRNPYPYGIQGHKIRLCLAPV
jgi:hypothetical protein